MKGTVSYFKHSLNIDQPAHTTVPVLKQMDLLKPDMEIQDFFKSLFFLLRYTLSAMLSFYLQLLRAEQYPCHPPHLP